LHTIKQNFLAQAPPSQQIQGESDFIGKGTPLAAKRIAVELKKISKIDTKSLVSPEFGTIE